MITKAYICCGTAGVSVRPSQQYFDAKGETGGLYWGYAYYFKKSSQQNKLIVKVSYNYVGLLDTDTGEIQLDEGSQFSTTSIIVDVIRRVLRAVWGEKQTALIKAGWEVTAWSSHCGRCWKYVGLDRSSGFCEGCNALIQLGYWDVTDVPNTENRDVASLQRYYWTTGHSSTLAQLRDACIDAGFDDNKAEKLIQATRLVRRNFHRGEKLPPAFLAYTGGGINE